MPDFTIPQGDLLIAPARQQWVEASLNHLLAQNFTQKGISAAADGFWDEGMSLVRPYNVENGRLTIPVQGVLLNGFPFQFGGWATGYEYIEAAVERGTADPMVREIVLDIDSPGGTVAGCFDCADAVYAARGTKPIRAFANEAAYSAAYCIASAADSVTVARTGGVGSIGVIATHVEMTGALEQRGLKVTLIYAGDRKADGHPAVPLSEEAEAAMQERVDALYEMFVSTVARNRAMDEQAVRDTEAATFMARAAIEIGLADAQGDLDSLSAYADPLEDDEDEMSNPDASTVEQAVTPEALAEAEAAARAEGARAGATAERERIAAILDSDEAADRPALAREIALTTEMEPEAAAKLLGKAAVEKKAEEASAPSRFETVMNGSEHPNVGGNEPAGEGNEPPRHERVLSITRQIGLAGFKPQEA